MLKQKYIFLILYSVILSYFILSPVSSLVFSSPTFTLNSTYNIETLIAFNVTNNASYPLYNLELSSKYTTTDKINLNAGEMKQINLKVKTTEIGGLTDNVKFIMYKSVNCSTIGAGEPFNVNITGVSSTPNTLSICKGESVRFNNIYESWIKLKIYPALDYGDQISSGNSYVKVFDTVGNFPFEVYPLIPGGNIEVTDTSIFLHSVSDDTTLPLIINSVMEATNLSITAFSTNYIINYDSNTNGFLIIQNIGSKKAIKVHLDATWFTFDINNFDLDIGGSKAVNFVISPYVSSTSETNISHTISVKVKADNVIEFVKNILIFVPYANIAEGNITTPEWWKAKKAFCDAYKTSPYCITDPVIVYQKVPEFACPAVLANLSAVDVQRILRESLKSFDSSETAYNFMKIIFGNITLSDSEIRQLLNQTTTDIASTKAEVKDTRTMFFIIVFGIIFSILFAGIGWYLYKYWKRKYRSSY